MFLSKAMPPKVAMLSDDQAFYHSIVDFNAGVQGSYLQLITADLDVKSKAEVTIRESSECFVTKDKVPWDKIKEWAAAHPPVPGQKRYFIQGALLSTITKTVYTEVSSNARVDGGAAFGAGGKVYATNKSTETRNLSCIGVHLIDLENIRSRDVADLREKGGPPPKKGTVVKSISFK
jgi:hypothetical protein